MADYKTLRDADFDRQLTLREAYHVMVQYVTDHFERGELTTGDLLTHLALIEGGGSLDPATLYDFLIAAEKVLDDGNEHTTPAR